MASIFFASLCSRSMVPKYGLDKIKLATDGPTFEKAVDLSAWADVKLDFFAGLRYA